MKGDLLLYFFGGTIGLLVKYVPDDILSVMCTSCLGSILLNCLESAIKNPGKNE